MKKIIILIISLFCLVYPSYAQFTTVSATITDFDNVAWSNAQWKVQFVPNPNQPNPCLYNVNGVGLCTSTYSNYTSQNNTTDGSGALSVTLIDNTQISPSGSQWIFTIQSNTSAPATQYLPLTISGSTMNLTTYLSVNSIVPRIKLGNLAGLYAYSDIEITNQTQGNMYWNVITQTSRQWTGVTWQNLVTSSWNGGTVVNPITAPDYNCSGSPSICFTGNVNGNLTGNVTGNLNGSVAGAASLNVLKAGDTMTGPLNLPATTPIGNNAVSAAELNAGVLPLSITQLCNATGPQDAKACYGAKGDVRWPFLTGTMSNGSPTLTITSGTVYSTDVGKIAVVYGCGSSSGENLYTTISTYNSPTSLTLATNCLFTGATNVTVQIGTDDTTPLMNCYAGAVNGKACYVGPGKYFVTTTYITSDNQHPADLIFNDATYIGIQSTSLPCCSGPQGMIQFFGAQGTKIYGHLTMNGNFNMNYPACLYIDSPYIETWDIDFTGCNKAIHIGPANNPADPGYPLAAGISEGIIHGGTTTENNMIFDMVGSNTIYYEDGVIAVIGPGGNTEFGPGFCTFHSVWCAVTNRSTIQTVGAWLYGTSGDVVDEYNGSPAVNIQPINDYGISSYKGSVGVVKLKNTHTEVTSLFTITNPNSYTTTNNNLAFQCDGCGGFIGVDTPLGIIDSTSYAIVRIVNSNFYTSGFSRSSATIVNNSVNANVDLDDSFNLGFKPGLAGISGINFHLYNDSNIYSAAGPVLPTCVAGLKGTTATVQDALTPSYMGTYVPNGGSGVPARVFCNGTNWVTN